MQACVLLDGDLQDPPELIEKFFEQWIDGADVVYGRRVERDMPAIWGLLYKAFYRVFAKFSYVKIPHDAGDFSLIDRRVVGWLLQCPERDLFLRGLRAYVGFRQTGVDYFRPKRMFGESTNNLIKNLEWAKRGIFSFSNTPLKLLTAGGVLLLALSLGLGLVLAVLRFWLPDMRRAASRRCCCSLCFSGRSTCSRSGLSANMSPRSWRRLREGRALSAPASSATAKSANCCRTVRSEHESAG